MHVHMENNGIKILVGRFNQNSLQHEIVITMKYLQINVFFLVRK